MMAAQHGERHHKARLSDEDVELMRELHEAHGLKVSEVAQKFEISYWTARDICKYRTRIRVAPAE